ncbi:MAG TPA: sulfotransferase [Gaiellaceae bacterium]
MTSPAPPVFVGGINRSGTTLMARIIGSSSAVAVPPSEFLFFGRRAGVPPADRAEFERRLAAILRWPRVREWDLDDREVMEHSRSWSASARSLFVLPLESYRTQTGKARLGEKSVLNEFRLDVLRAWFGDYRLVHMIRDPVAAYASSFAGQPPDARRAIRWGRVWLASAVTGLQPAREDAVRHRLVRYEDLTADPRATIASVAEFVGVPFEESAMLDLAGYDEKENSSFAASANGTYEGAIRNGDDVDRRAAVHPRDRLALASICGHAARALGYRLERRPSIAVALARAAVDARPRHRLRTLRATLS